MVLLQARSCLINLTLTREMRASRASEPRDRSAPSKRRARARVGESEGRKPLGLRLDDGLRSNDFFERQRHVDKADTTLAGHIPDEDLASVGPDGLPSD